MKRSKLILMLILCSVISARAQWTIDSLNTAGTGYINGATSSKAVFTNGTVWEVFDVLTHTHTYGMLSQTRSMIDVAVNGEKVYFGGGKYGSFADPLYTKKVDVYNATTNTWSVLQLSKAREVGGAGALGNKVVFAGGTGRDFGGPVYLYNKVDIFDAATGARTTAKLSKARSNIAVGSAVDKIVFAGGWYWDMMYNVLQSNTVDIYNVTTGTWTKTTLSKKRENISVAVIGTKIIFAGGSGGAFGGALTTVDIFDAATNTWSIGNLSVARYGMTSAVAGGKAFFAGGIGGALNLVEVYDVATNSWSTITIPVMLTNFSMSAINGKIYFAGGYDAATSNFSNLVQIYNPATGLWSTEYLSEARSSLSTCVVGNFGVFAGGIKAPAYPVTYSKRVDIYQSPLRYSPGVQEESISPDITLFPNPAFEELQLTINDAAFLPMHCVIFDRLGRVALLFNIDEESTLIDVSMLATGSYIISAGDDFGHHVVKTFYKQ